MSTGPTTIALHLPQFHPIGETDAWYGTGFTEWLDVARARPLFAGHDQPRLPRDLGFYDLRLPELREAQARVARAHGIDAFCYEHHWFEGHRPWRRVLDDVLEHGCPDLPFCLMWCNEHLNRRWDATGQEVLLTQRYSDADDDAHGHFLTRALDHPLALKVNGAPVLFVKRLGSLPDPAGTLARWRRLWRAAGIGEVQVVAVEAAGECVDPAAYGADASAPLLPGGVAEHVAPLSVSGAPDATTVFSYEEVAEHYAHAAPARWRRHECVLPGWDDSPRRGEHGSTVLHGSTPELYERWLSAARERAAEDGVVLINAWNDWGNGALLEPDLRHAHAYLDATARAVGATARAAPAAAPVAPLVAVPMAIRDRFAELYLDAVENLTLVQRRLSRLEGTFERQLELARSAAEAEAARMRADATALLLDNERLRAQLARMHPPALSAESHGEAG